MIMFNTNPLDVVIENYKRTYPVPRNLIAIKYDSNDINYNVLELDPAEIYKTNYDFVIQYFRVLMAKLGFAYAICKLKECISDIDTELYVAIAEELCFHVGRFKDQYDYLTLLPSKSKAWVERAKIRSLLFQGQFEKAESCVISDIATGQVINNEFSLNVLWQLNSWDNLFECCVPSSKIYPYVQKAVGLLGNSLSFHNVTSLYNSKTKNQILYQEFVANRSGYKIKSVEGFVPNILPKFLLGTLGGADYQVGIIGAYISHMKVLELFLDSDDPYCIVTESDTFFTTISDFSLLFDIMNSESYDFVLCSDRHVTTDKSNLTLRINPYSFLGRSSGFDGYVVSRRAANEILSQFKNPPYDQHIDGLVIKWLCNNDAFKVGVTSYPLFSQSFFSAFSTRTSVELDY